MPFKINVTTAAFALMNVVMRNLCLRAAALEVMYS